MGLTKHFLGEYITLLDNRNADLCYEADDVRGINNLKKIIKTKADISGRKFRNFYVVYPGDFVFNHRTSRNGDKFSITYNYENRPYIFTEDYVVFKIKDKCKDMLLTEWLYMFFCRPEFDRYVITNSWGSSTEFYNWEDICNIELVVPSIDIQKKYVNIYNAMVTNQQSYERGLEDLKLSMDALIEKFKYNEKRISIGEALEESDVRNIEGDILVVHGVNKDKEFMPSVACGTDLSKYKIVRKGQFACNLMHVGRDVAVPIALHKEDKPIIVSPAYFVFNLIDTSVLPEYAMMWLSRNETDRYAWFLSDTNVRSGMEKKRFCEIEIPIPDIQRQKALVEMYNVYIERRSINEKLKQQIKNLCPILIKGSLQ